MQDARKRSFTERVIRDLERAFPSPEPDSHRYVVEKDRFSFYLYDSRPRGETRPVTGQGRPWRSSASMTGEKVWQLSWMPPEGRWKKYGRYFDLDTAALVVKGDPAGCFMGAVSPLAYLARKKKESDK